MIELDKVMDGSVACDEAQEEALTFTQQTEGNTVVTWHLSMLCTKHAAVFART